MSIAADHSGSKLAGPAVRLRGVAMRYGDVEALRGLDLDIERGKATVLLGPNGAGKTTAIRLMLGLARPSSGTVEVFGADPRSRLARQRVGVMMQVAKVPETLRVGEHIDVFRTYYPRPLSKAALIEMTGLAGFERRYYGKLSGGEQQRVLFALSLAGDPDLLFLDEPTVGMDVETRRAFWRQVRRLRDDGRTILLTTHYLEEADALADRIVVLNRGAVVADGSPAKIKQSVTGRTIRCRTGLALDDIAAIAHVQRARAEGAMTLIDSARIEDVLRVLLSRDAELSELEITGAALEDAFVAITQAAEPESVS